MASNNRIKKIVKAFGEEGKSGISKEIFQGSLGSLFINVGNMALGFLLGIILARILGAESYGHYAYIFAMISILAVPTQLGLPNLLVRYIAKYEIENRWGELKGLLKWSNLLVITFSTVIILCVLIFTILTSDILRTERIITLFFGLLLLPFLALIELKGGALRGLRFIVLGKLPGKVIRQSLLTGVVLLAYLLWEDIDATHAMASHLLAAVIALGIATWWLNGKKPQIVNTINPDYEYSKWLKVAIPLMVVGGMSVLNSRIDVLMIGWFRPASEVGLYEIAVKGGSLVTVALLAFNMALAPYFSKLHTENEVSKLQKIVSKYVLLATLFAIPVIVIFLFWGYELLTIIFGHEFGMAYVALILVSLGQFIHVCAGSVGILFKMIGYEKLVLKVVGIATIFNIILNLLIIPKYGMNGAAVTSMITYFLWNSILVYYSINKLGIDTSLFSIFYKKGIFS